ncbi:MAG: alanine racemase [Chlamydiae bacterium]|nr:alanine racemase [Chlamydiota bacterium]
MKNSIYPSWIEIDLKQFKKNIKSIQNFTRPALFCLPIKANAYGHGLLQVAKAAEDMKVDYLAVASLHEAILLRKGNIMTPILVLGAIHEEQIQDLIDYDLEFSISSLYKAELVFSFCKKLKKKCKIHVEVDTGMRRTGVRPHTAIELVKFIKSKSCFNLKGIYSHFATADNPNDSFAKKQILEFKELLKKLKLQKNTIAHLANSGGVCFYPESWLDMIRCGLLAFGYFPTTSIKKLEITPCFSLKSKVSYFKVIEKNEGVSYGHVFTSKKSTRIVTVSIGYGDGYNRLLSNKGKVLIREKKYPIVGNICMDQFMVDIGEDSVYVGDEVVLIGKQGNEEIKLEEVAAICNTIPYEVLCFFNERLERFYLN